MKLLEGTHFLRRLEQPSRDGPRSKERVDCLLCLSVDDDGDNVGKRARLGYRLDKLQKHYKGKHMDSFPMDQPSRIASKEFVDCLFCRVPSFYYYR